MKTYESFDRNGRAVKMTVPGADAPQSVIAVKVRRHTTVAVPVADAKRILAERDAYLALADEVNDLQAKLSALTEKRDAEYDRIVGDRLTPSGAASARLLWDGESAITISTRYRIAATPASDSRSGSASMRARQMAQSNAGHLGWRS